MKLPRSKKHILVLLIVLLATVLRFYQLGSNPPSLDWDEASLGYNAYSIMKTGRDEYGTVLPLAIRSFGDYKPPLYTYLTIAPVALFGLSEFAVRLPSAIFGVLAVLSTYFLVEELIHRKKDPRITSSDHIPIITMLLLAISPWHIQFSRIAFEANIALALFITASWFFIKGIRSNRWMSVSAILYSLTLYAYHSVRLVAPVFVLGLVIAFVYKKTIKPKQLVIPGILGMLCTAPLFLTFLSGGQARFQSVTSLGSESLKDSIQLIEFDQTKGDTVGTLLHNRRIVYILTIAKGYLDHFDLNFLFVTGDGPGRHHAAGMGMLYFIELPFVVLGITLLLKRRITWAPFFFWWFLVAPLASALTSGTPHAVRSLLYLPTYQVFTAYGILSFFEWTKQHKKYQDVLRLLFFIAFAGNIYYYLHMYYTHTPIEHAKDWQYGYKQAVEIVKEHTADKIIVTYAYDQPYIYFLFYNPIDPAWYQNNWQQNPLARAERAFGKYEFRNINWEKDKDLENVMFVGTANEIPDGASGHIADVHFPDGTIAFRIVQR